jgi:hypothetical protein
VRRWRVHPVRRKAPHSGELGDAVAARNDGAQPRAQQNSAALGDGAEEFIEKEGMVV